MQMKSSSVVETMRHIVETMRHIVEVVRHIVAVMRHNVEVMRQTVSSVMWGMTVICSQCTTSRKVRSHSQFSC